MQQNAVKNSAVLEVQIDIRRLAELNEFFKHKGTPAKSKAALLRMSGELVANAAVARGMAKHQDSHQDAFRSLAKDGMAPNPARSGAKLRRAMTAESIDKDFGEDFLNSIVKTTDGADSLHAHRLEAILKMEEYEEGLLKRGVGKEDAKRLTEEYAAKLRTELGIEVAPDDKPKQLNDNEETKAVFDNTNVGMPEIVDDANTSKKSKRRKKA